MLENLYTPEILNLAANISHIGLLQNADICLSKTSSICGSKITVSVNIVNNHITAYGQEINACVLAQASAAILAKFVIGFSFNDLVLATKYLEEILKTGINSHKKGIYLFLQLFAPVHEFGERHEAILLPFKATLECFNTKRKDNFV